MSRHKTAIGTTNCKGTEGMRIALAGKYPTQEEEARELKIVLVKCKDVYITIAKYFKLGGNVTPELQSAIKEEVDKLKLQGQSLCDIKEYCEKLIADNIPKTIQTTIGIILKIFPNPSNIENLKLLIERNYFLTAENIAVGEYYYSN